MEYDKCNSIRLVKDNLIKIFDLIKKCEQFEQMTEGHETFDECNHDGKDLDWYGSDPPKKQLTKIYKE